MVTNAARTLTRSIYSVKLLDTIVNLAAYTNMKMQNGKQKCVHPHQFPFIVTNYIQLKDQPERQENARCKVSAISGVEQSTTICHIGFQFHT